MATTTYGKTATSSAEMAQNRANLASAISVINSNPTASAGSFAGSGDNAKALNTALSGTSPGTIIDAPTIGTTPQYQLPKRNVTDVGNIAGSINANLANSLASSGYTKDNTGQLVFTPPKDLNTANTDMLGNLRSLIDMTPRRESVYNDQAVKDQQNAVQQSRANLNNLTGQLNAITTKAQADILSTQGQGRGIPEAIIGGQQAQINREAAIAALPIQAQAAIAQGNLALAQESLDTLIKVRSDEINNDYNYKMQLFSSVKDFVTKAEDRQLKKLELAETRAYNEKKENLATINEWQKMAVKTGQSSLISQFSKLDPSSPTFSSELGNITSKVTDPMVKLDIDMKKAELEYKQKQMALLGEPSAKEKKDIEASLKEAKASLPVMRDKVELVDSISEHEGLSSRVGTNLQSRTPRGLGESVIKATSVIGIPALATDVYRGIAGQGQDFAGGVHKLTSGLSLQSLIDAKARGATFGALSEGELSLLSSSATALNDWEMKDDKGKGIGIWNIDEASFKRELNTIKELTNRAILLSQGTLVDPSEQAIIDNVYTPQNMNIPVNNYFNN